MKASDPCQKANFQPYLIEMVGKTKKRLDGVYRGIGAVVLSETSRRFSVFIFALAILLGLGATGVNPRLSFSEDSTNNSQASQEAVENAFLTPEEIAAKSAIKNPFFEGNYEPVSSNS